MRSRISILLMLFLGALPVMAQVSPGEATEAIENAEVHANFAATAGARTHAPTLYEDAMMRLDRARAALKDGDEAGASRAAVESGKASMAAEAKAKWRSTVGEITTLRSDLERLGAKLDPLEMMDEEALVLDQAENSRQRVSNAKEIVATAKAMRPTGAEGEELERAEVLLGSAEKIVARTKDNRVADHLAYVASMTARRAIYVTRLRDLAGVLPEMRLRRTELAQAQAAVEAEKAKREREAAEQRLAQARQQLQEEQNRRAAEQAEIARLRQDLKKQQEILAAELAGARTERIKAERRLDLLRAEYEAALSDSENETENVEALRQKVEDQELRLQQIREGEKDSEQALLTEIQALRADLKEEREQGRIPEEEIRRQEQELQQQEAEIEQLRRERVETMELRRKTEEEFRERIEKSEQQMREMAERSAELEANLAQEREARAKAERELARMRAEAEERARVEEERLAQMEQMKKQLAELADTRADERGFIVTLPGLFFDSGRASLKAGTKANLSKIAGLLDQMERVRIIVEGHTDSVGSAEMNQKLSEARADSVRDYLVDEGVNPREITTVGRGESQPIAPNDTAEGRSKNRRVEIVIEEIE